MSILSRLLARIDNNLEGSVERHLRLAGIPEQRSVSPDEFINRRDDVERIGTWPCCDGHCPSDCTDLHRDACASCGQGGVA